MFSLIDFLGIRYYTFKLHSHAWNDVLLLGFSKISPYWGVLLLQYLWSQSKFPSLPVVCLRQGSCWHHGVVVMIKCERWDTLPVWADRKCLLLLFFTQFVSTKNRVHYSESFMQLLNQQIQQSKTLYFSFDDCQIFQRLLSSWLSKSGNCFQVDEEMWSEGWRILACVVSVAHPLKRTGVCTVHFVQ